MNDHLRRAQVLLAQQRFDLAERELRAHLAQWPDDALAHAWLAQTLMEVPGHPPAEAVQEAQAAVHLAPQAGFAQAVLANALENQGRLKEAEAAAREAIRLEPEDAAYHARLAAILIRGSRWADAADAAQRGVEIAPDHVPCVNLRAVALRQMGRRDDAAAAIESALALDPENAATHANHGWQRLERGDANAAVAHFREALRLDPELQWARHGILEALRARNPVYRLLLRYFLWMGKLTPRVRWGVILGAYFVSRLLASASKTYPALAPYATGLLILYALFVYLVWTAKPLSSLLLRLDPIGRLALPPEQLRATNWVALCLALALVSLIVSFFWVTDAAFFSVILSALLVIPLSGLFSAKLARGRILVGSYTGAMAVGAALTVLGSAVGMAGLASGGFGLFLLMLAAYLWIGNIAIQRV